MEPRLVEEELVVPTRRGSADASKRDPASRDARSAPRGIEPATRRANVRAYRRARTTTGRKPAGAHDFPVTSRPVTALVFPDRSVVRTARRPVVVILREHGSTSFAPRGAFSLCFAPSRDATSGRVPEKESPRGFEPDTARTPPIAPAAETASAI